MLESTGHKTRKGADKRRQIVDAAVKVFARNGFDGSRIADIAREAGIAYGLVYHYFESKEAILDTIFLERWSDFIEEVEAIVHGPGSVEERLRRLAEGVARAYCEHSDWVKVLVFEIQRSQRVTDPERLQTVSRLFHLTADLLREGQARGELRDDIDADLACFIFVGGLDIVVTSRVLDLIPVDVGAGPGERDDEAFSRKVADTVTAVFLTGMSTRSAPGIRSGSACGFGRPIPADLAGPASGGRDAGGRAEDFATGVDEAFDEEEGGTSR